MRENNQKRGKLVGGSATKEVVASSRGIFAPSRSGASMGLQQYYTPLAVARFIAGALGVRQRPAPRGTWDYQQPISVLDPTAGDGALLSAVDDGSRWGIEIDDDQIRASEQFKRDYAGLRGDLQHVYPLLAGIGVNFTHVVSNPPFGLPWEIPGLGEGSSTLLGWRVSHALLAQHGAGCLIAGADRFAREVEPEMGEKCFALIKVRRLFPGTDLPCVLAFWFKMDANRASVADRLEVEVDGVAGLTEDLVAEVRAEHARAALHYLRPAYDPELPRLFHAARAEYDRDIARLVAQKGGFFAWEQGLGKSLGQGAFVRTLEVLGKLPDGCALFIMPQDLALQMSAEVERFFGRKLVRITCLGGDMKNPRKRRKGEASALEVRAMVRARRADLRAQRAGVHLAPRAPVWAATWFEALAITGRETVELPSQVVWRRWGTISEARWDYDQNLMVPAKRGWIQQGTTVGVCPVCRTDRRNGWDGTICHAVVDGDDDLKVAGFAKPRGCGYVHRALVRKPAYQVLAKLFRAVLVDEGTKMKGDDSLTSKAVRAFRAEYRAISTGTPLKNFVVDLFWLLWWALGDRSPRFPYAYVGGRERFIADFAVMETKLKDGYGANWDPNDPKQSHKPPKETGARPKMLPEVSNLLQLWKILCSSVVRRRMDEVGAVVSEDGAWTCPSCKAQARADVGAPGAWRKPAHLACGTCGAVADAIVPITYVPVRVPWGEQQRKLYAAWLCKDTFADHFRAKHPHSTLKEAFIRRYAGAIGQLAKLEYATTDPTGDPDRSNAAVMPDEVLKVAPSAWTPGRAKILQLARDHVARGERVLIGSCLVAPGPWIADRLVEAGVDAVHICDTDARGKATTRAPRARAQAVADFRAGRAQVLCVGVNAMCLGHNLDCASVVIIDGLAWDFSTHDQFIKRVRRLTSGRPVKVYVILPDNSLATLKWDRLGDKTAASDLALDGKLSTQHEEPMDLAALLQELIDRGARATGAEVAEEDVQRLWQAELPRECAA